MTKPALGNNSKLFADACALVNEARSYVASTANSAMTLLYWRIGKRINTELLEGKRAAYGEKIVSQLATQLQQTYGKKGFELRSIRRMMQFADLFPDMQIVSQAATLLSWPHFIELLPLELRHLSVVHTNILL